LGGFKTTWKMWKVEIIRRTKATVGGQNNLGAKTREEARRGESAS